MMKYIKYLLPALATGCLLYAYAINKPDSLKIKPERPAAPPVEQKAPTPIPIRLSGVEDGIPYGLHVVNIDNKAVTLQWNNPEPMNGYFDDFEGHSDFVINSPGNIGWEYLDMDNQETYTWTATAFPNQGQKMAFIVMNPSKTSPPTISNPNIKPYSGNKMLVAFTVDGGNNDFLISPELFFEEDFQVSFRAKSYTDNYGLERIRVGYSTTGKRASDFTYVSQAPYEEVPVEWTLMKYDIPKEAKYVTVNCVSQDAFMLLIDDLFVGTNKVRPKASTKNYLTGFNLYRNNVKVNDEAITEINYTDHVTEYGDCTYQVSAVYSDGSESDRSEELSVNVPDIRLLPFEDDFSNWVLNTDKWTMPVDEQGNENRWKVDYVAYGLVDPAASYGYSSLKNYSQSLITRELRTLDRDNTYLRFELRLQNYKGVDDDTLSVELSSDNKKWKEIASFCNGEGDYNWRVHQYCLKDLLDGEIFYLRFRAHGEEAFYLDYWYMDDVKVWNPQWASARMVVECQGSPLSNCPVTLTADHGAVIHANTDAGGIIEFPQIEKGTYAVSIEREGYNVYEENWEIKEESGNSFTANVIRPALKLSETAIHENMKAEEKIDRVLTLKNEGNGPLNWTLATDYSAGSGDISHRWDIQTSFNASGDLQSSVAFDGEHYYTASTYFLGKFFKYDKEGNFIEEFSIPGIYYKMYDFAFDGTYFYASDKSNILFQLDLRNKHLVKQIVINETLSITHCSYDPRNDQFWVGGYNSLGRVDREGKVTVDFHSISDDMEISAIGSAFDNITPGGPYLWFSNGVTSGTNIIDMVQIIQYNLNTRQVTDVMHHAGDVPGYKIGSERMGPTYLCGLETTTSLEDGSLSLIGILQQSPSRIFAYKLCDTDAWLSYSPKGGVLNSGDEQQVRVHINARNGKVGETYASDLNIYTIPELHIEKMKVSYTVTSASETPRPVNFRAMAEGNADVALSWEKGSTGMQPTGYHIYRNGQKITETPITVTQYTDHNLIRGDYTYTVTALYNADKESVPSDEASVFIKVGAPYFPPTGLTSSVAENKRVSLTWQAPGEMQKAPATLQWDNGINTDAMGMSEGGYFWAGVLWDEDDLIDYRNMVLDEVNVFVKEKYMSFTLQVYKDEKRVVSQVIRSDIRYGAFNTIKLTDPVTIEPGYSYKVAFLIAHEGGLRPIGMDNTMPVNGKGNLISMDGKEWYPASHQGLDQGNFNISVHLSPSTAVEQMPVSYNIYRDGERINAQAVTDNKYEDEITLPGNYEYRVASVYDGGESALSKSVQAEIISIGTPYAPSLLKAEVELNRTVKLRWNFPLGTDSSFPVDMTGMNVTCLEGHPEIVSMCRGYISGELGIASDGNYIYTSLFNSNGTVNKYSLNGEFIESFVVNAQMNGIRNLTYDGKYFYASDIGNSIYKLDMENKAIIDTIPISEVARHLTYIPDLDNGQGGFEVGDWESSIYVTMQGAKLADGNALKGAAGTAYYNGVLYTFEQGYEHPYVICSYDRKTGQLLQKIDLKDYAEINPETGASAGGMSVVTTKEGLHLLAVVLQEPSNSRFIFFDLGSIKGLEGYNVYRNGEKMNDQPLKFRYYTETESTPGEYSYEVETVYIDGTVSAKSQQATIEIFDPGQCDVPSDVKVRPTTYGYDVVISFVDPTSLDTDLYESVEEGASGEAFDKTGWTNTNQAWIVTEAEAYQGKKALTTEKITEGWLIIPAGSYSSDFIFSFAARNADDHQGNGELKVLISTDGNNPEDFTPLAPAVTTEAWKMYTYPLSPATEYIAICHKAGKQVQYVDAISINEKTRGLVYGYDILRDGKQLNEAPVIGISYTDHNLLPGKYDYQVRAHYTTSCISDLTDEVTLDLDYSNNCQKPGHLSAQRTEEGTSLQWSAPALGDAINLKWHSGNAYDAAGMPSGGCFFAGVQWTAEELEPYSSLSLSEVEFYINQIPDAVFVLVYEGNDLIYQQYVPELKQYSFNTAVLDNPVRINAERNLRVVVYVEHNEITVPLGYDEGPAKTKRGDLYSADGITWETLKDNEIDGNWNITLGLRAYSETNAEPITPVIARPQAFTARRTAQASESLRSVPLAKAQTSTRNTFDGYNVYCNSRLLNSEPLSVTSYQDISKHSETYLEYQVKAIYSGCGEVGSNVVRVMVSGINGQEMTEVQFRYENARIFIEGLAQGSQIVLFDATGKAVYTGIADDSCCHVIHTSNLAAGVYMVRAGNASCKLLIK